MRENRPCRSRRALGAAALATALAAMPAAANAAALEEIVVTGTRAPQAVMDASGSVSVITRAQLDRSTLPALADLLRASPGVQVTDAGQPGLKRIRIRGEESRRTAILVDGFELTDHWEVGTPLSLHPALVERIEVVRGSGSVLYGSRALSGVVNIITRKGGDRSLQGDFSSALDSATHGHEVFASLYGDLGATGYRFAAARSDHGLRRTPQGRIPDTAYDSDSLYGWVEHRFGNQRIELGFDSYEAASEVFVEDSVRTSFPLIDFRIDVPQRDRARLSAAWHWDGGDGALQSAQASIHRQWNDRRFDTVSVTLIPGPRPTLTDRSVYSDARLVLDDALVQLDWKPLPGHTLVTGVQYTAERVRQDRHVDTWVNGIAARPEDIRDVATLDTLALFALDTWEASDRLTVEFGAREYRVDGALERTDRPGLTPAKRGDDALIASLGARYSLSDDLVLRANAALGYVYPSLLQFATGAYAGSRFVNPTPDLDPERSRGAEFGLRWRHGGWVVDGGLFASTARDYIDHVLCTPASGCLSTRDKYYTNIGKSRAHGLELFAAREQGRWRPHLNLTWMRRDNSYEQFTTDDSGVPRLAGSLGLLVERTHSAVLSTWCDVVLRGETASRRQEPASSGAAVMNSDDSWLSVDISAGAAFGPDRRARLALELQNLADARYSTSAENLLAPGRSVALRLDYSLAR